MVWISLPILLFLLIFLSFVWPPDSPWSPWWRTNRKVARAACKLAKVTRKDIVYELGSGDGEFVLTAIKEFGAKRAVGIEIDPVRHLVSMLKKKLRNNENVSFVRSDFKKINLSDATVVYFYLVPAVIERITPKLKKELRPGTKIVSFKYKTGLNLDRSDSENKLFLYRI